jgi:cysteine-rich repeat protein
VPTCGDGILAGKEECDDANAAGGDGCSAMCEVEPGFECVMAPSKCASVCGDGILASDEACDDHDFDSGDGCSSTCVVEPHWSCVGEPSACTTPCGDGFIVGVETCDDGNLAGADGCGATCKTEPGWSCVGEPSVCSTGCGDGVLAGNESCDDGNALSGDGCNVFCKVEPGWACNAAMPTVCVTLCGDGYPAGPETCDDGNLINGDGCSSLCQAEHGYSCFNVPSVCSTICGDGVIGGAELCDDGNNLSGDGCSELCKLQPGFNCGGEPSACSSVCGDGILVAGELCDDGNLITGDCCSASCQAEPGCEVESNDGQLLANSYTAIAVNNVVKGFIKPGTDSDFYKLTLTLPANAPSGTVTAATLDGFSTAQCVPNTLDSLINIYDAGGNLLVSDNDGGPGLCSLASAAGFPAGDYFIEVKSGKAANPTPFDYILQITTQASICGNGLKDPGEQCDDGNLAAGDGCSPTCHFEGGIINEIEPNNSFASADQSALQINGDTLIAAAIDILLDKDFYKLTVPVASVIRFETFETVGRDCPSIATNLQIWTAQYGQKYANAGSGIKQCSAVIARFAPGTYYVSVEKAANAVIPFYMLEVKFMTDDGAEAEPNSMSSVASAMPGNDMFIYGDHQVANDSDYYQVTVPAGKSLRAEIIEGDLAKTCESNGIESYLTLYDGAGVPKIGDFDLGRGLCSLIDGTGSSPQAGSAHALPGGTYYLEVRSISVTASAIFNYRLAVTIR